MPRKKGARVAQDENRSRAWRAVKEFRKLQTSLNTYVRAVTGNPAARVLPTEGDTRTDGKTVWLRPPIELGDDVQHEREWCGRRNENKRQICQACDIREMAMACVFHETAHCVFGTFVRPVGSGIDVVRDLIREWHPEGVCDHASKIFGSWNSVTWNTASSSYLDYALSFTPVFSFLLNALEDSRVNAAQFRARPGTKVVMDANIKQVFEDGIGSLDGNKAERWADRPLSMQVLIGAFLEAGGYYDLTETLHPAAQVVLRKPELSDLLLRISNADDAHSLVVHAADVFRRLYEEGVIDVLKCEPAPPIPPVPSTPSDRESDDSETESPGSSGSGESGSSDDETDQEKDPDAGGEFGQSKSGSASKPEDSEGEGDEIGTGQPGDSTMGRGGGGSTGDSGNDSQEGDSRDSASSDDTGDNDDSEQSADNEDGVSANADQLADESNQQNSCAASDESSETTRNASDASDGGDSTSRGDQSDEATGQSGDEVVSDSSDGADGADGSDGSDGDENGVSNGTDAGADEAGSGDGLQADTQGDVSEGGDGPESGQDDTTNRSSGTESGVDRAEASPGEAEQLDHDEVELDGASEPRGHGEAGPEEAVVPDYNLNEHNPDAEHDAMSVPDAPGEDEGDESAPVVKPLSIDEVLEVLKRITLHNIIRGRDELATGHSEIFEGDMAAPYDPASPLVSEMHADQIAAIATAVLQAAFFDTSSRDVRTVRTIKYGDRRHHWYERFDPDLFRPTESSISRTVQEARITFDANARGRRLPNLRSGKIDGRNLAKRVPAEDPRMFKKNVLPKRRDYKVIITIDISGSTRTDDRITRIKRAAYGQAEMLHRVGIPFELWAHSAGFAQGEDNDSDFSQMDMWMFPIKGMNDPWNKKAKQILADLVPQAGNLDGHTLEFMRKRAQVCGATDTIICYYTDGAMPASNYNEELEILQREIKLCRQLDIALLAVGIDTDSPEDHGFRTAQVNSDADLPKVVRILKEQMS